MSDKNKLQAVQEKYLANLKPVKRKTKKQLVIGLVGLVGSGKSHVSRELASHLGAVVIRADDIRIALRKAKLDFEPTRAVSEYATSHLLKRGCNIIIDSDFIDPEKRKELSKALASTKIKPLYLRTFIDKDLQFRKFIAKKAYSLNTDLFKDSAVAIREIWRRTPWHYTWDKANGGSWQLKKLSFPLLAEIDTTDPKKWKTEVKKLVTQLKQP